MCESKEIDSLQKEQDFKEAVRNIRRSQKEKVTNCNCETFFDYRERLFFQKQACYIDNQNVVSKMFTIAPRKVYE